MPWYRQPRVESVVDLVVNTPLVRLRSVEKRAGSGAQIWAKCEFMNPSGSVKDRAARQILLDAVEAGELRGERRLMDSTSGNTGVAYAMLGAALGVPITLVMPANVSVARKKITAAFGTEIIYSSELEGSDGAIVLAQRLSDEQPERYFYCDQYSNPGNIKAHYLGTGAEIIDAMGERVTHFVTGVGTTGTVMGTGKRLKEFNAAIEVIALQPDDSLHGLEGLKHLDSSLVPPIWRPEGIVDRMQPVSTDDGWDMSERLVADEGLFVGHSAGANVAGACEVARNASPDSLVVTVLCDRGDRYFPELRWEKDYVW